MTTRPEKWPVIGWWWHHPMTRSGSSGLVTDKTKKNKPKAKHDRARLRLRGKKDDQTNLNKEGVFQRWNVSFVRYDLQSNVTVFLVLFVQKIQGRDWRLPKTIEYELHVLLNSSNSHRLQIEILFSHTHTWNFGMQSPRINEHGNLCITTITFSSCN